MENFSDSISEYLGLGVIFGAVAGAMCAGIYDTWSVGINSSGICHQ